MGWRVGLDRRRLAGGATMWLVGLDDAAGVRRAAGLTAQRVNGLPDGLWELHPDQDPELKPLKENLGHTRLEVLVGSLIGPLVALPGLVWVGSPLAIAQHLGWIALG